MIKDSGSFRTSLVFIQSLQMSLLPKPVSWFGLFFAVSYSKLPLVFRLWNSIQNHYSICSESTELKISVYGQKNCTIHLCAMSKINNRTKSYWKCTFVECIGKSIVYCHLSVGECIQIYWRIQSQHRPLHENNNERIIIMKILVGILLKPNYCC